MIGIWMFFTALMMLLLGFPVAFTFAAVALIFAIIYGISEVGFDAGFFSGLLDGGKEGLSMFNLMPFRIFESIMQNTILMSVPMFIFMGIMLQKTRLAERLLESMGVLFGGIRGGVAISTVLVGTLLAAATGVVGASVVAMGVISLPVMLKYRYQPELACGTICAAGTLGQIIPPSLVLIILGDVLRVPVGDLFQAAMLPGLALVALYILYILARAYHRADIAPPIPIQTEQPKLNQIRSALLSIIPPLTLIVLVLGSIFAGIATPTESAAVGCVGAALLAAAYRSLSLQNIIESAQESVRVSAMVFGILIGATAFSMVFTYSGGDDLVEEAMLNLVGDEKMGFIFMTMLVIFLLGFFVDFIEISYIIVPILLPISESLGINPLWFGILIAMNLQTSFLTPPFGFSLFYLKGVAPPEIRTLQIYKGVLPFIVLQISLLALLAIYPQALGIQP